MADAAPAAAAKGAGWLKKIFTLGAIGTIATVGGMLLLPFFGVTAGGAAAAAGATNASVLGSFWAPLVTNTTGQVSASGAISKMFSGYAALGKSAWAVGATGVKAGMAGKPIFASLAAALQTPIGATPVLAAG